MVVLELESPEQFQQLLRVYNIVIVDNYADWCQPCKYLMPLYEKLSEEYATNQQVIFTKADAEKRMFQVKGLPCIRFYHNGQQVEEILGADFKKIEEIVTRLLPGQRQVVHQQPQAERQQAPQSKKESKYKSYGEMMK